MNPAKGRAAGASTKRLALDGTEKLSKDQHTADAEGYCRKAVIRSAPTALTRGTNNSDPKRSRAKQPRL